MSNIFLYDQTLIIPMTKTMCLNHRQCFITNNIIVSLTYCVLSKYLNSVPLGSHSFQFTSVQSLSHVQLFATPWTKARQAFLSITNSRSLLKLMSIESVMPPNHLILCCPFLLPPSIFSSIRVFSNESVLHIRWPKYWSSASASVFAMSILG